jgi:hypothetical protein
MGSKALILTLALAVIMPALSYADSDPCPIANASSRPFTEWLNAQPKNKPIDEKAEKIALREQWKRTLGFDLFYPYFKAKEVESKISEKASVKVFKIKGKPEVKEDSIKYIFRIKF